MCVLTAEVDTRTKRKRRPGGISTNVFIFSSIVNYIYVHVNSVGYSSLHSVKTVHLLKCERHTASDMLMCEYMHPELS